MKVLFVGDVHNHYYVFKDVHRLDERYKFDKIIFVGDYVDDWYTTNNESLETLDEVIELKKSNPDKYYFCIGNHELSYLGYPCSGHRFPKDKLVRLKLIQNINVFNYFVTIELDNKKFYCSHAGFLNDYLLHYLTQYGDWEDILQQMNTEPLKYLNHLNVCSKFRGGCYDYGSFVWADIREHKYEEHLGKKILPYQIIGHSPVIGIDIGDVMFIDTHSTYTDSTNIGDKSYLMWNEDKFEIVY